MTIVRGSLSGTYPYSEEIIRKIFDFKYGRDSIEPVKVLFEKELNELVARQNANGFPIVSTGNLGIEDLIRPFTQELDCLRSFKNLGDLPINRWHYTNTFYRQPTLVAKFPRDSQVLLNGKHRWVESYSQLYSVTQNFDTRGIVSGPYSLVTLVNRESTIYNNAEDAIIDAGDMIAHEIASLSDNIIEIQLDEPMFVWESLPRELRPAITKAYNSIREKNPSKTLIINTYFEDVTPILKFMLDLPVDGIGIDFHSTNILNISNFSFENKILQAGIIDSRNFIPDNSGGLSISHLEFMIALSQSLVKLNPKELIITSNTGLDLVPKPIADSYIDFIAKVVGGLK